MSINVASLIKTLQEYPAETIVVLSRDEEGNQFHKLAGIGYEMAEDPEEYDIELLDEEEEDEWVPNVLVLWP